MDPQRYELGDEIAHGGMGRIRTAVDRRLGREVAIKELLAPSRELAARFEREVLVTARLQHPGIVAVYEAGRWPSGEPFFAMRLVHGRPLKRVIADATTLDARLALLPHAIAIADAMAYAHGHRIIHRDLKPANVLVGELGETVVIDWGIAKDLAAATGDEVNDSGRAGDGDLTRVGSVMGTPGYMAPEQARGEPLDERADVYAIGAILYHLLAGAPPFVDQDSVAVMTKVATEGPPSLAAVAPGIAPDLLAIVDRAMAHAREARYPTARELAEDLRRFQTGQLVASHRYTRAQLVRRFLWRHRVAAGITSAAVIVLAVGAAISLGRIRDERDHAEVASAHAEAERGRADRERAVALDRLDALLVEKAAAAVDRHDPSAALATLAALSPGTAHLEAAHVVAAAAAAQHLPLVFADAGDALGDISLSPDGTQLAFANGKEVKTLDLATRATRMIGRHDDAGTAVAFSDDGRRIASAAFDGRVRIWDPATGRVQVIAHPQFELRYLALTPDGTRLVTDDNNARVRVWNLATGEAEVTLPGAHTIRLIGNTAVVWIFGPAHVYDLATRKERSIEIGMVPSDRVAIASDGTHVAYGRADGTIVSVDLATGVRRTLGRHGAEQVIRMAYLPGDASVVSVGTNHELRVWPVAGGASRLIGTSTGDGMLAVSPDGRTLVMAGELFDLETGDVEPLAETGTHWTYARDGKRVFAIVGHDIRAWSTQSSQRLVAHFAGTARQVAYLPDGRLVAADERGAVIDGGPLLAFPAKLVGQLALAGDRGAMLGADGIVRVLDLATHNSRELAGALETRPRTAPSDPAMTKLQGSNSYWRIRRSAREQRDRDGWFAPLAFARDGAHLAGAGTSGGTIRIWTLATGDAREIALAPYAVDVEALAFSLDDTQVFAATSDGKLHAIAIAGGSDRATDFPDLLEAIAPGTDGVATASVDHHVRVGDRELATHGDIVSALARDDRWLASGAQDKHVRVDDLRDGSSLAIEGNAGAILALAIGAGSVASADTAGAIVVYDLAAQHGRTLATHGSAVGSVAISPDGKRVAAASEDGLVREWTDAVPHDEPGLRAWLARTR